MSITVKPPYGYYTDADGSDLEGGKIYVGVAGLDAEANPVSVYWDSALTVAAAQPIRTIGGVPDNSGTPADFFTADDYSVTVRTSADMLVYSKLQLNANDPDNLGLFKTYDTVALLLASAEITRGTGAIWEAGGFRYIEVTSGGDVANAASVQLDVLAGDDGSYNVKAFGAIGDGVTDDAAAIIKAVTAASVVQGYGNEFYVASTVTVPTNTTVIGITFLVGGSYVVVATGGVGVHFKDCHIKSNLAGTRNGIYGFNMSHDDCSTDSCSCTDLTNSAFRNAAKRIQHKFPTATDCGWDLSQNTADAEDVRVYGGLAVRCGRHGYSTDAGATGVVFEGCHAIDIGDEATNEGHDAYHFEGCIDAKVINCTVRYTAAHPAVGAGTNGYSAFRESASVDSEVCGLTVYVDSGYSTTPSTRLFYIEGATDNLTISGLVMHNNSLEVMQMLCSNTSQQNATLENFKISGPHSYTQSAISSGFKIIRSGVVIGTGVETTFHNQFQSYELEVIDVVFKNVVNAINYDGAHETTVSGCTFNDVSGNCIDFGWTTYTAPYRPAEIAVTNNRFLGTIGVILKQNDATADCYFAGNIVHGAATTGLLASTGLVVAKNNYVTGSVGTTQSGTNTPAGPLDSNLNN